MPQLYRQVELRKGNQIRVCWIPNEHAKVGKVLKIREFTDFEGGWLVTQAWTTLDLDELTDIRSSRRTLEDKLDPHR